MRMNFIRETATSVYYGGVRLAKARDASGERVPNRTMFADYVNDSLSLYLQSNLAAAFHSGQPVLIEGETGIGKTRAVEKMAADLGWEVHALQFHAHLTVEDLVGVYQPTRSAGGRYSFQDGPVTSGLRQQEGRIKVILLEDVNVTMENGRAVRGMVQAVVDALEHNGAIDIPRRTHRILKRHGAAIPPLEERIEVSREKTKVVALVCPPAPERYAGRERLEPGFVDRWAHVKVPDGIWEKAREERLLGSIGLDVSKRRDLHD